MRNVVSISLALACAGIAFGGGERPQDRVPLENGEQVVEVICETLTEIECRVDSATIVFKREDVMGKIDYDGGEELERARRALDGNRVGSAELFQALAEKAALGRTRKVFEQHALRGWATALFSAGDFKMAASKYAELVQKYPKTQYLYDAAETGVECYLQSGQDEEAKAFVGLLQTVIVNDGGQFSATRDYLAAAVEEKSNPAAAKAAYERVERGAAAYPEIQRNAKVGGARCMLAAKDYAGAERKFREVAEGGSQGDLVIRAWNGVGDVNLARADLERNPANRMPLVKAALLAYLRSAIQYYPEVGESREEKAKSAVKAGQCFEMYADTFNDRQRRAEYQARAQGLYSDCVSKYGPDSVWGKVAVRKLGR